MSGSDFTGTHLAVLEANKLLNLPLVRDVAHHMGKLTAALKVQDTSTNIDGLMESVEQLIITLDRAFEDVAVFFETNVSNRALGYLIELQELRDRLGQIHSELGTISSSQYGALLAFQFQPQPHGRIFQMKEELKNNSIRISVCMRAIVMHLYHATTPTQPGTKSTPDQQMGIPDSACQNMTLCDPMRPMEQSDCHILIYICYTIARGLRHVRNMFRDHIATMYGAVQRYWGPESMADSPQVERPDNTTFKAFELAVTEETNVQDLVVYYEKSNLMNYTELLLTTNIATAVPFADTALANVYRIDLPNQRCVAVKCVKHSTAYKRLKRSARELACWASHRHPNILPVLGFAIVKGCLTMVSPWMKNGCITDFVNENPGVDRLALCTQLISAAAYLHRHNVVHGDIKSSNVLICDKGNVKVMDFGVSVMDHNRIKFTVTSASHGTQRWQAPEILLGETGSTKQGDMYALGMTLTEVYTGEHPYGSIDWNVQVMIKIISGRLRPSRPIRLPLDNNGNGLWELMEQCWVGKPDDRLTSCQALKRIQSIRH
ncbi:tyrosine kinase catalytic domain protein [Rhizoctonia solani AG-3 Rhs1AP]|uniref:Tyrosine kinase catalytic domain protein n=2 Tax=Rhizoctonia solani AG-3 TaxID=1086053 RepID=A0A074S1W0_9AGAM|nr:tyrosine kinase catalytic domain protein [Rhizoctonia solani AG-3 Rhs1AP]KEP50878.1 tyrosine kinase catalytic domain protein [Rhizoctonia solani 123E]